MPEFNVKNIEEKLNEKKLSLTLDELKKRVEGKSLLISTPCYGGVVTSEYALCVAETKRIGAYLNVPVHIDHLCNESLIQRARNYMFDIFYRSDFTHHLWIDADISWSDPLSPFVLLAFCDSKENDEKKSMDIIGAVYPKKYLNATKIYEAVKAGLADQNHSDMFRYGTDLAFNLKDSPSYVGNDRFIEVKEISTGFMMYSRKTADKMRVKYSETKYFPDHSETTDFNGKRPIYALFDCVLDKETKRYLSEDYTFIKRARDIGLNCYIAPFIQLYHKGNFNYSGSIQSMIQLGNKLKDYTIHFSGPLVKKEQKEG